MTITEKITRAKTDYDEVYEAGKKAQYNEFWDEALRPKSVWAYSFAGRSWTDKTFAPPKDIILVGSANGLFQACEIKDVKGICERLGVRIDFSQVISVNTFFADSEVRYFGEMDLRSVKALSTPLFNARFLISVDKIILMDDGSQTIDRFANNCTALEEIRFEGVIGQNGLNFQWSTKLSKASIISIINALSTTTSGLTVTLSKTAVENAFGSTTSAEWTTLIGTRSNWTISLV